MNAKPVLLAPALVTLLAGSVAAGAPRGSAAVPSDNKPLAALLDCRTIADGTARLACYDTNAKALADASAAQSIVVLDREAVRKTRRSLFGFEMPTLAIFGKPSGKEEAEAREITATVAGAGLDRDGRWLLTLDDGARWEQTDDNTVALPPHAGSKIVIRRAALGSFFLRIDGQPGIKGRRIS